MTRVLLLSTYEMGRQPFGLASPAAWLRDAGCDVAALDLSRQPLDPDAVRAADLVAFYLPMHTATRLAGPVIARVRELNPAARLCAYGLYAPLNESHLRALGVSDILGAEFEEELVDARALRRRTSAHRSVTAALPRLAFRVPDRRMLPALTRYARLHVGTDDVRTVGYTEATRGCKHLCRHCPIVPIYGGQFRVVPVDVVIADVRQQVEAGASHVTFGDPDFFNGPRHAMAIVERFAAEFPGVTYDVTIKIEHLLKHRALLPRLRETGCLFVTSAVEAVDDGILEKLAKGHTRADFVEAVALCREAGLTLAPTFVAFTPWTTIEGYGALLDDAARAGSDRARAVDPAGDQAADSRWIAAAGAGRHPRAGRSVRRRVARASVASSRSARRCAAGGHRARRRPRPASVAHGRSSSASRRWCAVAAGARATARRSVTRRACARPSGPAHRPRDGSVSRRALVLLSGADAGAGCSRLAGDDVET